jgi:hypothetical protein
VFETSELPESEQYLDEAVEASSSDCVETLHISTNEAFGRFKGKNIDSDGVDFSDRIRGRGRKG